MTLQERQEAMAKLREDIKASRYTYRTIADMCGNSPGWIGQCLRGNYEGCYLPHKIADCLARLGFNDAAFLKMDYGQSQAKKPHSPQSLDPWEVMKAFEIDKE